MNKIIKLNHHMMYCIKKIRHYQIKFLLQNNNYRKEEKTNNYKNKKHNK